MYRTRLIFDIDIYIIIKIQLNYRSISETPEKGPRNINYTETIRLVNYKYYLLLLLLTDHTHIDTATAPTAPRTLKLALITLILRSGGQFRAASVCVCFCCGQYQPTHSCSRLAGSAQHPISSSEHTFLPFLGPSLCRSP